MVNKAMILAAGFGTRLKPLTNSVPKALVPLRNGTMISYQIEKLKRYGIKDITVNAHHFAEQIENYFSENDFGVSINVIREDVILGTGGGIINAEKFLTDENGGGNGSFLAINVDVYTNFDLKYFIEYHLATSNMATLLVQKRNTSRFLVLGRDMRLEGRIKCDVPEESFYAFNGVHLISEGIFKLGYPVKYLDIIDIYLDAQKNHGKTVKCFDAGKSLFEDIGKINAYEKYKSDD
ncbi:MAG: NTP transferase domain-containing protein [Bacteroidetes bacterium]|nr:NTP transferase domain-containing protein [Bacteroidota bacterium]